MSSSFGVFFYEHIDMLHSFLSVLSDLRILFLSVLSKCSLLHRLSQRIRRKLHIQDVWKEKPASFTTTYWLSTSVAGVTLFCIPNWIPMNSGVFFFADIYIESRGKYRFSRFHRDLCLYFLHERSIYKLIFANGTNFVPKASDFLKKDVSLKII